MLYYVAVYCVITCIAYAQGCVILLVYELINLQNNDILMLQQK